MTSAGRSRRYNTGEPTLSELMADLSRRVKALEAGGGKGNLTIDSGSITLTSGASLVVRRDSDGAIVAKLGNLGDGLWGIQSNNPNTGNNTPLMISAASTPGGAFEAGVFSVVDQQGDAVFFLGEDWGISGPSFDYQFAPSSAHTTPTQSTTSGSFAALWTVYGYASHPGLRLSYLIQTDAATTAEVQMRDALATLDPPSAINAHGAAVTQYSTIEMNFLHDQTGLAAPFAGMLFKYELTARRVSGAGAVRLQLLSANGF